jgi:hypothetical protein
MLRITLPGNKWNARKHGGPKRHLWRKIHVGIDEETLEIRAIEVTGSNMVLSQFSSGLFRAMFAMKEIWNGTKIHS